MKTLQRTVLTKKGVLFLPLKPNFSQFYVLMHTPVVALTNNYLITIHTILQTLQQEWAKIMIIKLIQINVGTDEGNN